MLLSPNSLKLFFFLANVLRRVVLPPAGRGGCSRWCHRRGGWFRCKGGGSHLCQLCCNSSGVSTSTVPDTVVMLLLFVPSKFSSQHLPLLPTPLCSSLHPPVFLTPFGLGRGLQGEQLADWVSARRGSGGDADHAMLGPSGSGAWASRRGKTHPWGGQVSLSDQSLNSTCSSSSLYPEPGCQSQVLFQDLEKQLVACAAQLWICRYQEEAGARDLPAALQLQPLHWNHPWSFRGNHSGDFSHRDPVRRCLFYHFRINYSIYSKWLKSLIIMHITCIRNQLSLWCKYLVFPF